MMKSVTGVSGPAGNDVYASALRDDVDPRQTERDARKTLDDIGDQFDSGEYDRLGPSAFSAMNLVSLAWARMGWRKFLARRHDGIDPVSEFGMAAQPVGGQSATVWAGSSKGRPER